MKDITLFINEAKQLPSINFDDFKDEIEKLNEKFNKRFDFGVFNDEGEHLYIHPKDTKKWYSAVPDKFILDHWAIDDISKFAPKLSENIYIAVKTFEVPNRQSRINGQIKHCARPVLTHQGMFFNSDKECKQFIKAVKNELRPDISDVKKYKLIPMTIKEFVDFLNDETHKGSYYSYEHYDAQFVKYEG